MPRHSYTVLVIMLLLGVLAAKLLLTRVQSRPVQSSSFSYEAMRGWPWPYSRSVRTNDPGSGMPGAWVTTYFSWGALVADVAVLLVALAVAGLFLGRRYRRLGRLLRFSLGEMQILVTIAAIACGWLSLRYRQWRLERHTLASFRSGTFNTREEYRGPEWLRRIVPGDRLTIFNRAVEVSVSDAWTDDTTIASLVRLLATAPYVHKLYSRATLACHLTEPVPFANIDEVCLYSDDTADEIHQALARIAHWRQLRKLTIEVDTRQSFRSGFGRRVSDFDWRLRPHRPPPPPSTNLTDAAMTSLAEMPALKYLAIADCPDVTSEGIYRLAKSRSLVSVSLPDRADTSDASLKVLASRIKDLYLIQPDGGSRRFDPHKDTTIGASELFNEPGAQK